MRTSLLLTFLPLGFLLAIVMYVYLYSSRAATVTQLEFEVSTWSGWSKNQPPPQVFKFPIVEGAEISSADLGVRHFNFGFKIATVSEGSVKLHYKGISEGGSYSGPFEGEIDLKANLRLSFATPTMDAGCRIKIMAK